MRARRRTRAWGRPGGARKRRAQLMAVRLSTWKWLTEAGLSVCAHCSTAATTVASSVVLMWGGSGEAHAPEKCWLRV